MTFNQTSLFRQTREGINVLYNKMQFYWIWIYESSYWNKRDLNQLLPENNKDLKGHYERFEFFFLVQ